MRTGTRHPAPSRLLKHEKRLTRKGYSLIAGVDEAGRGPLAGPVVAACVVLKDRRFKNVIDDSKKLSPKLRELAYDEIMRKAHVGIGVVDERRIDEINIYNATARAMEMAITSLRIHPEIVLIDGRVKISSPYEKEFIIRGDSKSLSIAAASIVAKVVRDRIMVFIDELYPQYGFSRHKGYGTLLHRQALKKHGSSPVHRLSFKLLGDGS